MGASAQTAGDLAARGRRVKYIQAPSFSPVQLVRQLTYLSDYRDLLYTLSVHRIKVRYKQSMLGLAWAVVQPFALMLIYTIIFSIVIRVKWSGDVPYSIFVYSALLIWTMFASAVTTSATGLVGHTQLITKVYFPREILPLTYVVAAAFDLLVASVVMAGMMIVYAVPLTATAVWVIPILIIALMFSTALALFLSATQVWFRDVGLAMPLVMQVWMFATPVVYPLKDVPAWCRGYYILNPMVGVVENFRRVVVLGVPPDMESLTMAAVISAVLLPLSYAYFKHMDATMADVI